jgi:acetolactate synthase-1/2/3 large subunit
VNAAQVLVRSLEKEGVKYVFGLPGEEIEELLFAIKDSSIKFIVVRHEQAAAFMAEAYGKLTGKAGVCLATLGPGATNLLTGLADASLSKSPVIAITGQGAISRMHKESHQVLDVVSILKPITKFSKSITNGAEIAEVVQNAFKFAESEKPGVAHIELPEDIAKTEVHEVPLHIIREELSTTDTKTLNQIIDAIYKAKSPIILAGNGSVRHRENIENIRSIVQDFNIPIITTFTAKGVVSDRNPNSLFTLGSKKWEIQNDIISESDLIISIGVDLVEFYPETLEFINPEKNKRIIHIDYEQIVATEFYNPQITLTCDIGEALHRLYMNLRLQNYKSSNDWIQNARKLLIKKAENSFSKYKEHLKVSDILKILREKIDDKDILISDVGDHKIKIAKYFPAYEPNTVLISNGLASMGNALPSAIAVKLVHHERNVVVINGDGGFLMNSQELETAKRLRLGFTVIILTDGDFGLISLKQRDHRHKSFGTRFSNPDFVKYAESFGVNGFKVQNAVELNKILDICLNNKELNVIEIPI